MPRSIKRTSQNGFTILELMIVITIAAILSTLALPEISYTINTNKVKSSASDMHLMLLLARSEAIKRNSNVEVSQVGTGWEVKSGTTLLRKYDQLPERVSVVCNTTNVTCPSSPVVTYERTGRTDSASASEFRFYMNGENIFSRCVVISINGKPRVYTDNDYDYSNGCT